MRTSREYCGFFSKVVDGSTAIYNSALCCIGMAGAYFRTMVDGGIGSNIDAT